MKKKFASSLIFAASLLALAFPTGCETGGQVATATVQAAGEAGGNYLLVSHYTPGTSFVDPAFLAGYESMLPKIAAVMQGAVTPADFTQIVQAFRSSGKLTPGQAAALGVFDSVSDSFVTTNGMNNLTPEGANVALAAGNLAQGLAKSVGSITGTNWTLPVWVPPTQGAVVPAAAAKVLLGK